MNNPHVTEINQTYLMKCEEFQEFKNKKQSENNAVLDECDKCDLTPPELFDQEYKEIQQQVSDEILDRMKGCTPEFFEKLVVELLVIMGYEGSIEDAGKAIGKSGDEGIDGIIKEDVLGLDMIYVQAKRWENVVGRSEIQKFAGSLEGQCAWKGVFITTSGFTQGAKEYVVNLIEKKIILINGNDLAGYMFKYNIDVSKITEYILIKVDIDYFEE